jgi:hypothetical protein
VGYVLKSSIPKDVLAERYVRLVIKAINDSKEQQYQELNGRGFNINNGRYQDRWNYLFHNIEVLFSDKPFKCYEICRSALWGFVAIYNLGSKILYIILKKDRFNTIKNDHESMYHYVKVLNSINSNKPFITISKPKQISLFPTKEPSSEHIFDDLESMLSDIKDEIKWCVDILFTENANGVDSISGNLATYDLDIFKTYNWNKYIVPTITEISDTKEGGIVKSDKNPPIELKIRKGKPREYKEQDMVAKKEKDDRGKKNTDGN